MLTPTRTILIRGTASAAKHTANQNTTTAATTNASRNVLKEAQPKLISGHNLHNDHFANQTTTTTFAAGAHSNTTDAYQKNRKCRCSLRSPEQRAKRRNTPSDTDHPSPKHRECLNHFAHQSARSAAKRLVSTSSHRPTPIKSAVPAIGHFAYKNTTTTAETRVNHHAPTHAS